MKAYQELSKEELLTLKAELNAAYEDAKGKGLKLDMSRGKPAVNQLDMTMDYLDVVNSQSAMKAEDGMDVRNYGRAVRAVIGTASAAVKSDENILFTSFVETVYEQSAGRNR